MTIVTYNYFKAESHFDRPNFKLFEPFSRVLRLNFKRVKTEGRAFLI